MKLELHEKGNIQVYEIEFDYFREAYDILAWIGGYAGFSQYNRKLSEITYELFIRDKDYRLYRYDAQRDSNTIEIKLLDDLLAVIKL